MNLGFFFAFVLLLMINFVVTLSKFIALQNYLLAACGFINKRTDA